MIKPLLRAAAAATLLAGSSQAAIVITEWMYSGDEFIEFTNTGSTAVDFTGWSYDDSTRTPGQVSLSAFGIVQPGQSVILAESDEAAFRTEWSLAPSVVVIGSNADNLGRADEINLYDAASNLVDRLTYDDQNLGGPRTQNASGITDPANYGANDVTRWVLSQSGTGLAYTSNGGFVGSPGLAAVPEPSAAVLAGLAGLLSGIRRRRI